MIHPTAWIGPDVDVGEDARIGPHVSIEGNVVIGDRVTINAGARIGVDGFGYTLEPDGHLERKPQSHGVVIEDDVHVGANAVIARGSYRDTRIGAGTKIDAGAFVAHNVQIGANVMVIALAEISGSVVIGDGAIVSPGAAVRDHVTIGQGSHVGLGAAVVCDVPAGETWAGVPARKLR